MNSSTTQVLRRSITSLGLIAIAIIHILDLPSKWSEVKYLGVGYVAVIIASLVLVERIVLKKNIVDYYLSAALAGGVLTGFIITRTVGLPGAMDDIGNWLEPVGLVSIVVEAFVVWNSLRAVREFNTNKSEKNYEPVKSKRDLVGSN